MSSSTLVVNKGTTSASDVQLIHRFRIEDPNTQQKKKGLRFWLIFLAITVALYEAVFELSAVSMALATIAEDLKATDFVWIGGAYALSASCALPMSGGLAQAFGRRYVMVGALVIFAIGATVCGAATNMNMMITGRALQGIGGGGIFSLPSIILSDLVPLNERGAYNGLLGITWSLAIVTSAIVGGALADAGKWRWIFYLNLPLTAVSIALVATLLRVPTPKGNISSKLKQLDWIGNFIVVTSTCLCCIGLTWAGVKYSWASIQVLAPLCIGFVGLLGFVVYEIKVAKTPLIPFQLLSNRTSVVGYIATFLSTIAALGALYYFPVYLQACKGDSPMASGGLDWVGYSTSTGPFGIVAGFLVVKMNRYRPIIFLGWSLVIIGLGLLTRLEADSFRGIMIVYEVVLGLGAGTLYTTTYFPVLAPLPVQENARALAFFYFCHAFAQVWGVTIGASVLQNQLLHRLPADFVVQLPQGVAVAFSAIPQIKHLPEPLRTAVREAFAKSLRTLWIVLLAIMSVGALFLPFMKEIKMQEYTDSDWGIEEKDA